MRLVIIVQTRSEDKVKKSRRRKTVTTRTSLYSKTNSLANITSI